MIQVEGLTKYYGAEAAIADLNFSIERGEVIGFLGLNGAGKSTTLRILGCVLLPTSGRATIDGFDVTSDPHEIRKRIGLLPDTPPLYNEMTVGGYLAFVAGLRGVPSSEIPRRVGEAEERTALADVHEQVIGTLSHGYRQRVGVAQALVHRPQLLILDEPTSGLDPVQIVEMRQLIRNLRGDHTILLSSHILSEISQTCDRLLVIQKGRIVAQGTEDELAARLSGQTGTIDVVVGVRDGQSVPSALAALKKVTNVDGKVVLERPQQAHLRCEARPDAVAEVVRALVAANVDVLSVNTSVKLESIFLTLTQETARRGSA